MLNKTGLPEFPRARSCYAKEACKIPTPTRSALGLRVLRRVHI